MKSKFTLVFFLAVFSCINLFSQTPAASVLSGSWDDVNTWDCACVPATGYDVTITAGTAVTATVTAVCTTIEIWGDLVIDPGVTLTVDGNTNANISFGQDFTIEGSTPGTVTNNGTLILDAGTSGAFYEDQAGGIFTNNSIFIIDNGGYYTENGALTNGGTITIDNTSVFENLASLTNTGTITIDNGAIYLEKGALVNTGGTIDINSTTGLTRLDMSVNVNNTGGIINVNNNGTLKNKTGGSFTAGLGTINMNAGGIYEHNQDGGTIPVCTNPWDATSTCLITGQTTALTPTGLAQNFGNFTWNCPGQGANVSLGGNLTTVQGDFTFIETGSPSRQLQLSTTQAPNITIGGDLIIAAVGTDILQFATTAGSPTVTVGGDLVISSGRIVMGATAGASTPILNVSGDYIHSATGSGNELRMSGGNGTTGTLNLSGDLNYSSTTINLISETATGTGIINFVGNVTHTFSVANATPFSGKMQVVVDGGDVLDISGSASNLTLQNIAQGVNTFTVNATGTLSTGTTTITANAGTIFNLAAGATLNTNNVSGVSAAAAGTIQGTGTKTFDNAANYILGNASTTTGFTNNATMNDLTTTASAVLGQSIIVNGDFLNSAGTFSSSGFTITAATLTNNGTLTAGASILNCTGTFTNGGTFNANTSILNVGGNFSNGGTFNANTGTVEMNGAAPQTIGGASTTSFNNLNQSNATGVSLIQNANLIGVLTINAGIFDVNGNNFILRSDASGTASIAEITGTGGGGEPNFAGNIIMERYTGPSTTTDWRLLGFPVPGTIGDWADDFYTTGFGGSDDPSDPFVSIQWYDEALDGDLDVGYTNVFDVSDAIVEGRGYWVFLGPPTPTTYSVTGAPNKFSKSLPVSFTAQFSDDDDGWCLVSNPYPCVIDWDDADWSKNSVNDAIYIYNSTTGTYAYHVPGITPDSSGSAQGIDGNGGSQYIASQQAFWIKVNTDDPGNEDLTATEGVKTTVGTADLLRKASSPNTSHYPSAFKDFPIPASSNDTPGRLKLTASGNGIDDEIFVHFTQSATTNFDGKYDAWKLLNFGFMTHNFSSVMHDSVDLAVNGLPSLTADVHIPLRLTVPSTGTYKISRDSILMLPLSSCIILEDKVTASMIDLRSNVSYTFTISDTTVLPRFILHIYAPMTKKALDATCSNSSNGMAIATGTGTGPWNYIWKNSAGTTVKTTTASSTADTLFNCISGAYSVTVNGACGTVTDTIIVNAPALLTSSNSQTNVSCYGGSDGTASVAASGGTSMAIGPPYTYQWGIGQTTSALVNLSYGNYAVMITDANGCTATTTVAISQPPLLAAAYTASSYTLDIAVSNTVTFTNTSSGAVSYQWNFGDGSALDASVNPTHSYTATGSYTVTLISFDGPCSDTSYKTIVVVDSNPTGLNENPSSSSVNVVYDNGEVFLLFSFNKEMRVNISVYNMIGERVSSQNNLLVKNATATGGHPQGEKVKLEFPSSSAGIYIAVTEMTDAVISKKIIIPVR